MLISDWFLQILAFALDAEVPRAALLRTLRVVRRGIEACGSEGVPKAQFPSWSKWSPKRCGFINSGSDMFEMDPPWRLPERLQMQSETAQTFLLGEKMLPRCWLHV